VKLGSVSDANGRRRVVVTGVGAVTPIGNDAETFWQALLAGTSGAAPIALFDAQPYPVTFACELKEFRRPTGSTTRAPAGWIGSLRW
jgi:3-oxoacyl-(acyl-carrier-protein) synthase